MFSRRWMASRIGGGRTLCSRGLGCGLWRTWWLRTPRGLVWLPRLPTSLGMRSLMRPGSRRRRIQFAIVRTYFTPCGGGVWGASPGPGPVPLVHNGPLRGAVAVPSGLGGYGLS
ncbi:unnamed protein product [Calypogeia fissa]